MTIDEKLALVRKALEMGADVAVKFHSRVVDSEESAKVITEELQGMIQKPFEKSEGDISNWFASYDYENNFEATVFFKK